MHVTYFLHYREANKTLISISIFHWPTSLHNGITFHLTFLPQSRNFDIFDKIPVFKRNVSYGFFFLQQMRIRISSKGNFCFIEVTGTWRYKFFHNKNKYPIPNNTLCIYRYGVFILILRNNYNVRCLWSRYAFCYLMSGLTTRCVGNLF